MSKIANIQRDLPFHDKKVLLVKEHDTADIVDAIKKNHGRYTKQYDEICPVFYGNNADEIGQQIFAFLKKNIRYDVEPDNFQTVKSPGAIVHQRFGDCKHYASFINGVCGSLERQGLPVHCFYRFVSDTPGRDIHHVFAVVVDKRTGAEYWVDPVLNKYDSRPHFYNIQDHDMAHIGEIYRISGLEGMNNFNSRAESNYPGGPNNLPVVWGIGKKKKNNIFKKIATGIKKVEHGAVVNLKNTAKSVKKVEHGAVVNLKNAAKAVKSVTLKVSMAPARGSFLALVDLNAFNLATRLADTWNNNPSKKAALIRKWKDIGGTETGLRNAINNGIKHKASVHHQAPAKKISGCMVGYVLPTGRVIRIYPRTYVVRTAHEAYRHPSDDLGRKPMVSGIGVVVAIPVLLALATAIIAMMKQFLKPSPKDDQDMASGARDGANNLITNTSDAIDQQNAGKKHHKAKGGALDQAVAAGDQPDMDVTTSTDPETGDPVLQVNAVNHPQINNAGQITPGSSTALIDPNANDPGSAGESDGPDSVNPNSLVNAPHNLGVDFKRDFIGPIEDQIKQIWEGYKTPILFAGVGLIAYKVMTRKKKGRRR